MRFTNNLIVYINGITKINKKDNKKSKKLKKIVEKHKKGGPRCEKKSAILK
jgi:hypothetical protein